MTTAKRYRYDGRIEASSKEHEHGKRSVDGNVCLDMNNVDNSQKHRYRNANATTNTIRLLKTELDRHD
jgi:hypothetical protein